MTKKQVNNPLHGITLETILLKLEEQIGWEEMGNKLKLNVLPTILVLNPV